MSLQFLANFFHLTSQSSNITLGYLTIVTSNRKIWEWYPILGWSVLQPSGIVTSQIFLLTMYHNLVGSDKMISNERLSGTCLISKEVWILPCFAKRHYVTKSWFLKTRENWQNVFCSRTLCSHQFRNLILLHNDEIQWNYFPTKSGIMSMYQH